jgi:hypothetical protein
MLKRFLSEGPYRSQLGCIAPYQQFTKAFAAWLDDPVFQLAFLQRNNRVGDALTAIGHAVAPLPSYRGQPSDTDGGLWVANVAGPGSRTLCNRRVVLEDNCLQPADMSTEEQRSLTRHQPKEVA